MRATEILHQAKADFAATKLIMVDQVIRTFLGRVANDPTLYRILVTCNQGFDYEGEMKKAVVRDRFGARFVLPRNRHTVVALVTGILYAFDKKEGDSSVVNFVLSYFNTSSIPQSYQRFLEEVIFPYLSAFGELIHPTLPKEEQAAEPEKVYFPQEACEEAERWIKLLRDKVISDNDLYETDRKEMVEMLNGMLYVFGEGNPLLIPIVWTGLKNTIGDYPRGEAELHELESVLRSYNLLRS